MSYAYEDLSTNEVRDLLRKWRENNERKSEDIMELWNKVLETDLHKFGNEKYVILEQITMAALDTHTYDVANYCISQLAKDFPGSLRVMRLHTELMVAKGDLRCIEMLENMVKADETNALARKRQVADMKNMGLIPEAIYKLVEYLKKFMSDVEGWQELCNLYLQTGEYPRAAFCAEELLLHQPHNHHHHQRLADIRYTMGGVENMEMAKAYYCQALKLNPDNMRALLGLFLTTTNLLNHYKPDSSKRSEVWKLHQWTQQQVSRRQKAAKPDKTDVLSLTQTMLNLAIAD